MLPDPADAPVRRRSLVEAARAGLARTGIASPLLALVLVGHIGWGLGRLPSGAIVKRAGLLREYAEMGPAWHFRHTDEETLRIVAWLMDTVQPGQAVLFEGIEQGSLQLLAPVLFPALLVEASALAADGTAAGLPVFAERAPWWAPETQGRPVVVGSLEALRLVTR